MCLLLSHVQLFVTPWTVARQARLSMGFSMQKHWGGLPFPSPGDLPNLGIQPGAPALQEDFLPAELPGKPHTLPTGVQVTLRRDARPIQIARHHFYH